MVSKHLRAGQCLCWDDYVQRSGDDDDDYCKALLCKQLSSSLELQEVPAP